MTLSFDGKIWDGLLGGSKSIDSSISFLGRLGSAFICLVVVSKRLAGQTGNKALK